MKFSVPKPSPAMIIACMALFVALSGSALAAGLAKNSVTSKQVKNSSLTGSDIKNNSLTGADIKESKLSKVPSASTADSATSAATAGSATTAGSASAIADNTVTSSKVVDGSLTGKDVGRLSGDFTYDPPSVAANSCDSSAHDIDPGNADMRDDAFVMTADQAWPTGLSYSVENSDSPGFVRLNICNVTGAPIDPSLQTFHWVAIPTG